MGYICGLIAADGSLGKDHGRIKLTLKEEDKKTLEFFANTVTQPPLSLRYYQKGLNERVVQTKNLVNRFHQSQGSFEVTGTSLHSLYQYCLDMGITPNKSLTLDVKLDDKSDEFKWAFLRGVIDGDGTTYVHSKKKELVGINISIISASEKFIDTLKHWFGGRKVHLELREMWRLEFSGTYAKQLLTYLPLDDFTMDRKTKKLNEMVSIPYKFRTDSKLIGEIYKTSPIETEQERKHKEIINLYHKYKSSYKMLKELGIDSSYTTWVLRKYDIPIYNNRKRSLKNGQ